MTYTRLCTWRWGLSRGADLNCDYKQESPRCFIFSMWVTTVSVLTMFQVICTVLNTLNILPHLIATKTFHSPFLICYRGLRTIAAKFLISHSLFSIPTATALTQVFISFHMNCWMYFLIKLLLSGLSPLLIHPPHCWSTYLYKRQTSHYHSRAKASKPVSMWGRTCYGPCLPLDT